MIFPRSSRVVIAALVLLANLASPDLVCAEHGGDEVLGATPVDAPHHDTAEHHHGPAAPDDGCEEPALPNCCPALMSSLRNWFNCRSTSGDVRKRRASPMSVSPR